MQLTLVDNILDKITIEIKGIKPRGKPRTHCSPQAAGYCTQEIIKKAKNGFNLLPRRWVVERSFAWLSGFRRLSKHYEFHLQTATAFVYLAFISLLLNRLFTIY